MKLRGALLAISLALALLAPHLVLGQGTPVYQNGTAIPNHIAKLVTQGRIADAGDLYGDDKGVGAAPFSITDNLGIGLCFNSGPTLASYQSFCLGHDAQGNAVILINGESVNVPGGATGGADVRAWGAKCDGATDDTVAIKAAIASGQKLVLFPATPCVVTLLDPPPASVTLRGVSPYSSTIRTKSATGDVLPLSNPGVTVERLGFDSAVTRTAGCYVHLKAPTLTLRDYFMNKAYCAYQVDDGANINFVDDGYIFDSLGAGQGVVQYGSGAGAGSVAGYFGHTVMNSGTPSHVALTITNNGDLMLDKLQVLSANVDLELAPGSGQSVTSLKCSGSYFDHGGTSMLVQPTGTGVVARSHFDDCWFGSGDTNNINMIASGSAYIDGLTFSNSQALLAPTGSGLALVGNVRNVQWLGGIIAGNQDGVFDARASGFDGFTVANACIGACGGLSGNTTGILRGNAGDYADISHNDLRGNGTAYVSTNTGTHNRVEKNRGLNPKGNVVPTVGPSPWTYIPGELPVTVYLFGGTVSSIEINGTFLFAMSGAPLVIPLEPNDTMKVTYTVAPAINVQVH